MSEIVQPLRFCGVLCIARSVASLGRHAQLTRCFSAVAELLVILDVNKLGDWSSCSITIGLSVIVAGWRCRSGDSHEH